MSNMLASDLANPEFVNPSNPDNQLSVVFYSKTLQDMFKTETEGRPIFNDCEMVRITMPGDQLTIIDTFAREDHKKRFPRQWEHYKAGRAGDQRLVGKTPLTAWNQLTPAQAEELRHMKFYAVEDIANASDEAISRIGMAAGMSPYAFREAAANFLMASKDAAALSKSQKEVQELRDQMAQMQQQFAALAQQNAPQGAVEAPAEETPARRGRPPRNE
jgi:hypothetical protein